MLASSSVIRSSPTSTSSSSSMCSSSLPRVLVILGTTGAGKTQLSVELARRFDGEIINCDAMQMYQVCLLREREIMCV
jgi:flagellar biosynthesis GTPase FlhF